MFYIDGPGATVDHKFTEGDPAAGIAATTVTDDFMNDVQQEILTVLAAAGIAPAKNTQDQLLKAIQGVGANGLFTTPPLWDVSKKAATSEFVQRALGNLTGAAVVAANAVLAVTDFGKMILCNTGNAITVTLPPIGPPVLTGATLHIRNVGGSTVTILPPAGGTMGTIATSNLPNMVITPGASIEFTVQGTNYFAAGSGALKYTTDFSLSNAQNGYQRLPSGLLIQWGDTTSGISNDVVVNYPIQFPAFLLGIFATPYIGGTNTRDTTVMVRTDGGSRSTFSAGCFLTSARINEAIHWLALGI